MQAIALFSSVVPFSRTFVFLLVQFHQFLFAFSRLNRVSLAQVCAPFLASSNQLDHRIQLELSSFLFLVFRCRPSYFQAIYFALSWISLSQNRIALILSLQQSSWSSHSSWSMLIFPIHISNWAHAQNLLSSVTSHLRFSWSLDPLPSSTCL